MVSEIHSMSPSPNWKIEWRISIWRVYGTGDHTSDFFCLLRPTCPVAFQDLVPVFERLVALGMAPPKDRGLMVAFINLMQNTKNTMRAEFHSTSKEYLPAWQCVSRRQLHPSALLPSSRSLVTWAKNSASEVTVVSLCFILFFRLVSFQCGVFLWARRIWIKVCLRLRRLDPSSWTAREVETKGRRGAFGNDVLQVLRGKTWFKTWQRLAGEIWQVQRTFASSGKCPQWGVASAWIQDDQSQSLQAMLHETKRKCFSKGKA